MVYNGAWNDFIHDYFYFNMIYTKNFGDASILGQVKSAWHFVTLLPVAVAFMVLLGEIICKSKSRAFHVGYFVYMGITIYLLAITGLPLNHYGMTLLPMLIYPFCLLVNRMKLCCGKKDRVSIVLALYLLIFNVFSYLAIDGRNLYAVMYSNGNVPEKDVAEYILKNTEEDDLISVFGNRNSIYLLSDRHWALKYSYQCPIGEISHDIMDEYYIELEQIKPKFIVTYEGGSMYNEFITFLDENGYKKDK